MVELVNEMKKMNKLLVLSILQGKTQSECILLLNKVGFRQTEIAELLGTTANTVNSAIQKSKKKKFKWVNQN